MADKERRWNLDDIYPIAKFDEFYTSLERDIDQLPKLLSQASPQMSAEVFREIIEYDEQVVRKMSMLGGLPGLSEETDIKDENAKLLSRRYRDLGLKYQEVTRSFEHWLDGKEVEGFEKLDDENARRLYQTVPDMAYIFQKSRENAKYLLSQKEESIIDEKDASLNTPIIQLREMLVNDFTFRFKPASAKRVKVIKNEADLMQSRYSPNPEDREAHYKALFEPYAANIDKLFLIYQSLVTDWDKNAERRKFQTPMSIRNLSNDIPDEAVETLLDVCTKNAGVFQDYFRYKAKLLGMEKLRRYDIYAPTGEVEIPKIPFEKGVDLILDTFGEFSDAFKQKAKQILDENHVDSHPRKNKNNGAFCWTVCPNISPYILLNYDGTQTALSTFAHELGHGVHALLSNQLHPSAQQAGLALAETASTFSELVLFDKLLEKSEDDSVKREMLLDKLGSSYATIMRQAYFVKFEKLAHEAIKKGITSKDLNRIYMNTLEEQFGDSVSIAPEFENEWAFVTHLFRTPFYCYSYSFGDLLSMSLYNKYKVEGKGFVQKIEEILSKGSSENPEKLLTHIGVDIKSEEFWQGGFEQVKKWQETLEKLK